MILSGPVARKPVYLGQIPEEYDESPHQFAAVGRHISSNLAAGRLVNIGGEDIG
jgi:hypothetical protein